MARYETLGSKRWVRGEKQVVEVGTGKVYTLTQPKQLFREDSYSVTRAIAYMNFEGSKAAIGLYVYEFSYLVEGSVYSQVIVDEDTAFALLENNYYSFMRSDALEDIRAFFASYKEPGSDGEYHIKVKEVLSCTVVVSTEDAGSLEEALDIVEQSYHNEEIVLDAEDMRYTSLEVCYREENKRVWL